MSNKRWNKEQIQILNEKYSDESWEVLERLLYPFVKEEIIHKAYKLKLKRKNYLWSKEEIIFLKQNIGKLSYKQFSLLLNKSPEAITTKAYKLGLLSSQEWTDKEIEILKQMYKTKTSIQISKVIDRKPLNINNKAKKLGLKKEWFSHYDLDEFINNLKIYAEILGRTPICTEVYNQEWSPSAMTINRLFGGYRKACEIADLPINANIFGLKYQLYESKNKDKCWSKSELIVTNFFIDNNIEYIREPFYKSYIEDDRCNTKTCDWVIGKDIFVEYFGMIDNKKYKIRSNVKIDICKDSEIKIIALTIKDLSKLNKIFEEFIVDKQNP